jgi:hypothetical protein
LFILFGSPRSRPRRDRLHKRTELHHENLGRPFLVERTRVWGREMDAATRKLCERGAAEALERFGYPLSV